MKHLFLFLFLTAALFHGTPSLCDTAKDDDAEELKQAVEPIKKAAEQGDITAQYKLGVLYSQGIGMEQDNAKACRWYRKAAEQGDMKAQYMLGRMYYNGEGVPQDFVKARQWWEKAAARAWGSGRMTARRSSCGNSPPPKDLSPLSSSLVTCTTGARGVSYRITAWPASGGKKPRIGATPAHK